jgi:hypothetical protein
MQKVGGAAIAGEVEPGFGRAHDAIHAQYDSQPVPSPSASRSYGSLALGKTEQAPAQ